MDQAILVGDIGSTKSSWWYGGSPAQELHLKGYNPIAHPEAAGYELFKHLRDRTDRISFSDIWYYGAGVIGHDSAQVVRLGLKDHFPESRIHVHSDLVGACIAACGDKTGTVAILGTGSHAASWDGQKIIHQALSLGYILGDEGGGTDIGKALIQAYFYQEMPDVISMAMKERLPSGRHGLLSGLQASHSPNQYLAEFARVAVLFQDHSWIKDLISLRFGLFVHRHIVPLQAGPTVHVVGSIGCIFASLIREELAKCHFLAGQFIKDPGLRLFERHYEYGKK